MSSKYTDTPNRYELNRWERMPQQYTPPASYSWCDAPTDSTGPWKIGYGTHRGVLMSRDEATVPLPLATWAEVRTMMQGIIDAVAPLGHAIWYANAYPVNGGEPARILIGAPYER